jgi:glycerate 2-kinase
MSLEQPMNTLRHDAKSIYLASLAAVDVREAVRAHLACGQQALVCAGLSIPYEEFDELIVVAAGKAALPMYEAAHAVLRGLPDRIVLRSLVITPTISSAQGAQILFGSHPIPSQDSLAAAEAVVRLLETATRRSGVLFLISGGASAMMEKPIDASISIEDIAPFYETLVASGLNITQMNVLRKYVSAVKGGRLAGFARAGRFKGSLLVSDVPGQQADVIGSGPTVPDSSTPAEFMELLSTLGARVHVPDSITRYAHSDACQDTLKAGDDVFADSSWNVILSSEHLRDAASAAAAAHGYFPVVDTTCDDMEFREAAQALLHRARSLADGRARCCLISIGEVSVALPPQPGIGGRNQHFVLECVRRLAVFPAPIALLSAGTDGIDGNSPAAGAIADNLTLERAEGMGMDPDTFLRDFNATAFFSALGDLIVTGPTGNNLRDLCLVLLAPDGE